MIGVVDNGCIKVEFEASVPEKQKGHGVFMGKTFSVPYNLFTGAKKNTVASLAKKEPSVYVRQFSQFVSPSGCMQVRLKCRLSTVVQAERDADHANEEGKGRARCTSARVDRSGTSHRRGGGGFRCDR